MPDERQPVDAESIASIRWAAREPGLRRQAAESNNRSSARARRSPRRGGSLARSATTTSADCAGSGMSALPRHAGMIHHNRGSFLVADANAVAVMQAATVAR
jgi:hypothetical protein